MCTKLEAFPLRSGTKQECTLSLYLFDSVLEVLGNSIRHKKTIKSKIIEIEEIKLFTDDMISL